MFKFAFVLVMALSIKAQAQVFKVYNEVDGGQGTAFLLNTSHGKVTVTANHVCGAAGVLITRIEGDPTIHYLIVKARHEQADLCILTPIPGIRALDMAERYFDGQYVFFIGYPAGVRTTKVGYLNGVTMYADHYHNVATAVAKPGASGSPLMDSKGRVVGVVVIGNDRMSGSVPLEFLKDILDTYP